MNNPDPSVEMIDTDQTHLLIEIKF